ncbi:hypothetical protein Tco_0617060 [Tanacetum coccineum]
MDLVEIIKFCDTLERVLKEVKLKIFESGFLKKAPLLGELDLDKMKAYEREITKRLNHRKQMRRWESFVNERPILSTIRRQIPSTLLPPHYHVSIGRPRKKRRLAKCKMSEKILKNMGHNKRACTSPKKKQGSKKNARQKGVPYCEPSEVARGSSQPMDSQATQQVCGQRRRSARKASKEPEV